MMKYTVVPRVLGGGHIKGTQPMTHQLTTLAVVVQLVEFSGAAIRVGLPNPTGINNRFEILVEINLDNTVVVGIVF